MASALLGTRPHSGGCSLHPTATGATMGWVCLFVPGLARPSSIDGYLTDLAGRAFSMTQKYCNILAADLFVDALVLLLQGLLFCSAQWCAVLHFPRIVPNVWQPSPQFIGLIRVLLLLSLPWTAVSCGGGSSSNTPAPAPTPASLSLTVTPTAIILLPNSSLVVDVTAQGSNISATPTVTLNNLPAGLTTTTTFPLSVPATGASITLQASASIASGQYTLTLSGQAGSTTTSVSIPVTVQTTPLPAFYFVSPLFSEVQVPIGGSGAYQFSTGFNATSPPTYLVALSIIDLT